MKRKITELFDITYPIISGGMVWCSGWRLASAVSNNGGLGLIGAGSMHPDTLREHIKKCRKAVSGKTFGVNIPLFYPELEAVINIVIEEKVPVIFTSGGNPSLYTERLHQAGIKVAHVVSSVKFALKAEAAGVDAVVCEGFEAGGHNGRDEITTMVLTPMVASAVQIPVIAAGGIASGRQWLATEALGAQGVQIGSLFALTTESSAHENFKSLCTTLGEDATMLSLKKITPVRLIKNKFFNQVVEAENQCVSTEELRKLLGKGRAKSGIFEGDIDEGELEIGQAVASINDIKNVYDVMQELIKEHDTIKQNL